jgi:hypothetical protein
MTEMVFNILKRTDRIKTNVVKQGNLLGRNFFYPVGV